MLIHRIVCVSIHAIPRAWHTTLLSSNCSDDNNVTPRLFYSTGEMNPNIHKQVESRMVQTPLTDTEEAITKKMMKTTKKKTK